jgi:hypothetical protein
MPLTVNVGYSEKLGRPDFGSIGASCHIECELNGRPAYDDPEQFQNKIRDLYAACAQAVQEELARRSAGDLEPRKTATNGTSKHGPNGATARKTSPGTQGANNHRASARQIEYLERLARENRSIGIRRLETLAERICGKPLAGLSSFDASSLIDTLKAVKESRLDLDAVLPGEVR